MHAFSRFFLKLLTNYPLNICGLADLNFRKNSYLLPQTFAKTFAVEILASFVSVQLCELCDSVVKSLCPLLPRYPNRRLYHGDTGYTEFHGGIVTRRSRSGRSSRKHWPWRRRLLFRPPVSGKAIPAHTYGRREGTRYPNRGAGP